MEVAIESANRARSSLEEKPLPSSMCFMSSSEKMPVRRPVPMNVPSVSNVSDIENAKIVTSTSGSLDTSENSAGKPSALKITPKVCGSWANVSEMDTELDMLVRPIGMPMIAVMTMVSSMPPLSLSTVNTMANSRPIRNSHRVGVFSVARPGVAPVARPLPAALVSFGVKVTRLTLSMPT